MKEKLPGILIMILIGSGLALLCYPPVSQWYNQKYQINAIMEYDESVSRMKAEAAAEERRKAREYNAALTGEDIEDPFILGSGSVLPDNYMSILDIHSGIMGYIEIPVIEVYLPIYHGTSSEVLEAGVGHMEMTAFPIGGEGGHSVLTGHTGLPDALLFTRLTEVEEGNIFYISILDEIIAYEVDRILVVEPDDTTALKPVEGEDYITLITCTPYAVNSHRLLVRGKRIPYNPEEKEREEGEAENKKLYYAAVIAILLILGIILKHRKWRK